MVASSKGLPEMKDRSLVLIYANILLRRASQRLTVLCQSCGSQVLSEAQVHLHLRRLVTQETETDWRAGH